MKQPLFDVIISAYGDTDTGKTHHSVRIVGRYKQHDGEAVGEKGDCTLAEALDYAKDAVTAFMEGTEA